MRGNIVEGASFDNFTKKQIVDATGRARVSTFPGLRLNPNNTVSVIDRKLFIKNLKEVYNQGGVTLNGRTQKLIEDYISSKSAFSPAAGIPGTHAEVRTYNAITTKYPDITDAEITIATVRENNNTYTGSIFEACSNCGGIIPHGNSKVNIVTGVKKIDE